MSMFIVTELITNSRSAYGGPCQHCRKTISPGGTIVKLTKCCEKHEPAWKPGAKNGPGVWVCKDCAMNLLSGEIHDG